MLQSIDGAGFLGKAIGDTKYKQKRLPHTSTPSIDLRAEKKVYTAFATLNGPRFKDSKSSLV